MSMRRPLAWAISGQFLTFVVQFTGTVVLARLLSPQEMGIYAIAMAALGIVQVATTFGVASYVVREASLSASVLEAAFTINAVLVISLTILLTILSFAAGIILGASEAGEVLRIVALGNLLAIINFRPAAMLQREMQFKQLSIIAIVNGVVQTIATVILALNGQSFMSPAYASLISGASATLLTVTYGRRYNGFRMSMSNWRPITKFGFQIMSVNGIALLNGKISELLIGRLLGVGSLGLYNRASGLSGIIFTNLYGTFTRVVFSKLSQDYRNGSDWQGTYLRSFSMITAFMWPVLIGLAILSGPLVLILYGERWLPAALPLSALMVAQFIGVAFGMNWELFVLRNEVNRQARAEVLRFVIGMPLFMVACIFGIVAASIAKIGDAIIGLALYYPQVQRLAELGKKDVPTIYLSSGMLTIAAVFPVSIVMHLYHWSPRVPLMVLCPAIGLGIIFWVGMIFISNHPIKEEILVMWRKLRGI